MLLLISYHLLKIKSGRWIEQDENIQETSPYPRQYLVLDRYVEV